MGSDIQYRICHIRNDDMGGYIGLFYRFIILYRADDALMYDYLKKNGLENRWKQVVANKYIIARIAALSSTL